MNTRKLFSFAQRKSMDTCSDPYLLQGVSYEAAVCKRCHAIYQNKRWCFNDELFEKMNEWKSLNKVLCPACQKIKDKFPGGIVTLKGEFLREHKNEILNLIRNEEHKAMGFNPLERIMAMNDIKEGMELTTTNEKLAQRIGKSVQKAYQGRVGYKWSQDTKLLRVEWER
ncbi:MAG: ATPase [Nitrospirae bacterium]|nr:ATPase [Nitrospirota bacterium]